MRRLEGTEWNTESKGVRYAFQRLKMAEGSSSSPEKRARCPGRDLFGPLASEIPKIVPPFIPRITDLPGTTA
jgi:hypothetical protein